MKIRVRKQSIHLREKNIAGFSMKMMFAAGLRTLTAACQIWYESRQQFREAAYENS